MNEFRSFLKDINELFDLAHQNEPDEAQLKLKQFGEKYGLENETELKKLWEHVKYVGLVSI